MFLSNKKKLVLKMFGAFIQKCFKHIIKTWGIFWNVSNEHKVPESSSNNAFKQ
jgi:hypothetical protein